MKKVIFYATVLFSAFVLVYSLIYVFREAWFLILHIIGSVAILTVAFLHAERFKEKARVPKMILYYFGWTFIGFLFLSFIGMIFIADFLSSHKDPGGHTVMIYGIVTGLYTLVCAWYFLSIRKVEK